jgi:hypothetical protein
MGIMLQTLHTLRPSRRYNFKSWSSLRQVTTVDFGRAAHLLPLRQGDLEIHAHPDALPTFPPNPGKTRGLRNSAHPAEGKCIT